MNFLKYIWYFPLFFRLDKLGLDSTDMKNLMDFITNVDIKGRFILRLNSKFSHSSKYVNLLHKLSLIEFYLKVLRMEQSERDKLERSLESYGFKIERCDSECLRFEKNYIPLKF